ncbi:MAG: DsrE family protein [Myxococcales bacterium]|nr:DsrE family protein [Myxococcales bacterium]
MEPHLIIITRGREDGGQAALLGIKLALALQAMGTPTSIFLTLAGTRWAFEGTGEDVQLPDEPNLATYVSTYLEQEGPMLVCSPCLDAYCFLPTMDSDSFRKSLRKGAIYAGLSSVAEIMIKGQVTVF